MQRVMGNPKMGSPSNVSRPKDTTSACGPKSATTCKAVCQTLKPVVRSKMTDDGQIDSVHAGHELLRRPGGVDHRRVWGLAMGPQGKTPRHTSHSKKRCACVSLAHQQRVPPPMATLSKAGHGKGGAATSSLQGLHALRNEAPSGALAVVIGAAPAGDFVARAKAAFTQVRPGVHAAN